MKEYIKYFIECFIFYMAGSAIFCGIIVYIQCHPIFLRHLSLVVVLSILATSIKFIYNYFYRKKSNLDDEDHATFI